MQLNVKALAVACGAIWGGSVLCLVLLNQVVPGYGGAFLAMVASIYPGFHPGTLAGGLIGTLYALVDGAIGGALVAWLYNMMNGRPSTR